MKKPTELIRGSGNVYKDFGRADADIRQAKAILGAQIIGILDDKKLSTRKAQKLTGVDHSDFIRIRNANFSRFTLDRLIAILNKLDQQVDIKVKITPRSKVKVKPSARVEVGV